MTRSNPYPPLLASWAFHFMRTLGKFTVIYAWTALGFWQRLHVDFSPDPNIILTETISNIPIPPALIGRFDLGSPIRNHSDPVATWLYRVVRYRIRRMLLATSAFFGGAKLITVGGARNLWERGARAHSTINARDGRVDHWNVTDAGGDERFSAWPWAGLLCTFGARLLWCEHYWTYFEMNKRNWLWWWVCNGESQLLWRRYHRKTSRKGRFSSLWEDVLSKSSSNEINTFVSCFIVDSGISYWQWNVHQIEISRNVQNNECI